MLEVDHSTDVRRRKLGIYQGERLSGDLGAGAVGVLGTHAGAGDSCPAWGRCRRLSRGVGQSAAFPGWKADEVFRALTEDPLSASAWEALERVARAMGAREGTKPEDDPITRSISREAAAKGYVKGRTEGTHATVLQVLESRGIAVSTSLPRHLAEVGDISDAELVHAALACRNEADFRRRIR